MANTTTTAVVQEDTRWQLSDSGSIVWNPDQAIPHYDHIEMSGSADQIQENNFSRSCGYN